MSIPTTIITVLLSVAGGTALLLLIRSHDVRGTNRKIRRLVDERWWANDPHSTST